MTDHPTHAPALSIFQREYGKAPTHASYAPGRVNIIGEHTDYNEGFVLPGAIRFGTSVVIGPRKDNSVRICSTNYPNEVEAFELNHISANQSAKLWANYIKGVLLTLIQDGHSLSGMNIGICGDIPQGAGLSSSASLEVATALAVSELHQLDLSPVQLARVGQMAENHFVGCNCGIMDQLAAACGEENAVLMLDCRTLTFTQAFVPDTLDLVIINPLVERKLVGSEYNVRRTSCEEAAKILGVRALRDVSMALLDERRNALDDVTYRRARHIITENLRVHQMRDALLQADEVKIGQLLRASHASMQHDFEITTKELDFVADTVNELCQGRGGARMTGGGFGGCALALIPKTRSKTVLDELEVRYQEAFGFSPIFYRSKLSAGAHSVAATKPIDTHKRSMKESA